MKIEREILYCLLIIILLSIVLSMTIAKYKIVNDERDYYKSQMISFCKIVNIQSKILESYNVTVPPLKENCYDWEINK